MNSLDVPVPDLLRVKMQASTGTSPSGQLANRRAKAARHSFSGRGKGKKGVAVVPELSQETHGLSVCRPSRHWRDASET